MSYTGGSLLRKGIKALVDGPTVKIIKDAGAIPLLVSNTVQVWITLNSVQVYIVIIFFMVIHWIHMIEEEHQEDHQEVR